MNATTHYMRDYSAMEGSESPLDGYGEAAGSRRDAAEGCTLLLGRAPQRARVLPRLLSAQSRQAPALENSIVLLWKRQCN